MMIEMKSWMKIVTPLLCASMLVLFGCQKPTRTSISGQIQGAQGKTIYLEQFLNNKSVRTDSTVIASDGTFHLAVSDPLEMNFYWLRLSQKDYVVLVTDSTEQITIKAEAGNFDKTLNIEGSEYTNLLRDFDNACEPYFLKEAEANRALQTATSEESQIAAAAAVKQARNEKVTYIKTWLDSNSSTPVAIAALQMLDARAESDVFERVLNDLSKTFSHSIHFKLLKQQYDSVNGRVGNKSRVMPSNAEGVLVGVGNDAPEIAMKDPSGNLRKLSDLRGKVVLIDFWASWCRPCRGENPNVVAAYKKYNAQGFEVMSVSLDSSLESWKKAIEQDGLLWPNHVSDLNKWQNKAALDYGVHSIPFPVLVNRDGKIVAMGNNVRGPMLHAQLVELFGQ
jgi:peroxiredoxin/GTPase SAR1 family protein